MNRFAIVIGLGHGSNEADEVAKDVLALLDDIPDAYRVVHFEVHQEDVTTVEIHGDNRVISKAPWKHDAGPFERHDPDNDRNITGGFIP